MDITKVLGFQHSNLNFTTFLYETLNKNMQIVIT